MLTSQTMQYTDPNTGETVEFSMLIEQSLINPGQKPIFPDFSPQEGINVGQISGSEWEAIGEEIYANLFAQILINPLFQDIVQLFQI